jgi:FRG domain.
MTSADYTVDLDTAEQFLEYIRPSRSHWDTYLQGKLRWVFRGQRDANWALLPSAWRTDEASKVTMEHLSSNYGTEGLSTFEHHFERCRLTTPSYVADINSQSETELRILQEFIAHANAAGMPLPYSSVEIQPQDFGFIAAFQGKEIDYPGYEQRNGHFFDIALRSQSMDFGDINEELGNSPELHEEIRSLREAWPFLINFTMRNPVAALAQHHGIPTRLLDWSHDSRIAAYFACSNINEEEMADFNKRVSVFALNPFLLQRERITEDDLAQFPNDTEAAKVHLSQHSTFVEKSETTSYLAAQSGLFTHPDFADLFRILTGEYPTIDKSIELMINWKQHTSSDGSHDIKDYIRKITLPYHESDRLMEMLDDERIFLATLMPSLDRMKESILARSIRSSRIAKRR